MLVVESERASSPVFFGRPRAGPLPRVPLAKVRGWSAERRILGKSPPCGGARLSTRSPSGAPVCGDLCPWTRASGRRSRRRALHPLPPRQAFASLRLLLVQPLKAAPRSGCGRAPKASRAEGCESPRGRRARPNRVSPLRPPGRRHISGAVLPGCSTSGSPLDASPHEQAMRNIRRIWVVVNRGPGVYSVTLHAVIAGLANP
jgi:hypothetical protein